MNKLRAAFAKFQAVQEYEFLNHDKKHPNDSVTDDDTDWRAFKILAFEDHLDEEIDEWHQKHDSDSLVDMANMCLLIWTVRRAKETA